MGSSRAAWRAGQTPKTTPTARLKPSGDDDDDGAEGEAPAGDRADDDRGGQADGDADQPAEQRQGQRLDEELGEDVDAAGADGLADADLAGPLADRDQHDVHDPDAAHDERDRGDARQEHVSSVRHRREGVEELGLVGDREVVRGRGRAVALAERRGDRRLGGVDPVGASRRSRRSSGRCRPTPSSAATRGERHVHRVVGAGDARAALRLEDADELERDAADPDRRVRDRPGRARGRRPWWRRGRPRAGRPRRRRR